MKIGKKYILVLLIMLGILLMTSACKPNAGAGAGKGQEDSFTKTIDKKPQTTGSGASNVQPQGEPLTVDIISVPSPVSPGSLITLFIKTKPNADCDVKVGYKGGRNEAEALISKKAPENGMISWTWTIDPSLAYGKYPITVTARDEYGAVAADKVDIEIKSAEECSK